MQVFFEFAVFVLIFFLFAAIESFLELAVSRLYFKLAKSRSSGKLNLWEFLSEEVITGRSICDHCKKELDFISIFPLFGYLLRGGKCLRCKKNISPKYFFNELIFGLLSSIGLTYLILIGKSPVQIGIAIILLIFLWIFSLIDIYFMRVSERLLRISLLLVLLLAFFGVMKSADPLNFLLEIVISAIGIVIFMIFVNFLTKKRGFGEGDIKFMLIAGLLLGYGVTLTFYIAVISGGVYGIFRAVFEAIKKGNIKKFTIKNMHIPFVPFLSFGIYVVYFYGPIILDYLEKYFVFFS